jgi:CBS domain-containing protein
VVDADGRPRGTIAESNVMANLEFHGGSDPTPILGGHTARKRWRKAAAATAAELMSGPPVMVCADERVSQAAKRLADSPQPVLCIVDQDVRLVGVVTARNLLTVYQRSDERSGLSYPGSVGSTQTRRMP